MWTACDSMRTPRHATGGRRRAKRWFSFALAMSALQHASKATPSTPSVAYVLTTPSLSSMPSSKQRHRVVGHGKKEKKNREIEDVEASLCCCPCLPRARRMPASGRLRPSLGLLELHAKNCALAFFSLTMYSQLHFLDGGQRRPSSVDTLPKRTAALRKKTASPKTVGSPSTRSTGLHEPALQARHNYELPVIGYR